MIAEQLAWLRQHFYVDLRSQSVSGWQLGLEVRSFVGSHGDPHLCAADMSTYMYAADLERLVDTAARCKGWPGEVNRAALLVPLYLYNDPSVETEK